MSHTPIIDKWPSLSDFAADLGIQYGTAKAMRRRGSIPADRWVEVVEKAKARKLKGVSLEVLALAAAERAA